MKYFISAIILAILIFKLEGSETTKDLSPAIINNHFKRLKPARLKYPPLIYLNFGTNIPNPTVGLSFRSSQLPIRVEFNGKITIPATPIVMGCSGSISILPTFTTKNGLIYFGIGGGFHDTLCAFHSFSPFHGPMIPVFLGYENTTYFIDGGCDLLSTASSKFKKPIPYPSLRVGSHF
jgi:hypothetical protein